MSYTQEDVHDESSDRLGNLVWTSLNEDGAIMVEVRYINGRRHIRVWYEDGVTDPDTGQDVGDPIDPDELDDRA